MSIAWDGPPPALGGTTSSGPGGIGPCGCIGSPPVVVVVAGATVVPKTPLPTMRAELARYCWMRSSLQLPCMSSSFLSASTSLRRDLAVCVSAWCSLLMARSVASSSATATLLFARHRLAASRFRARGSVACAGNVVGCMEGPGRAGPNGLLLVAIVSVVVVV